MEYNVIKNEVYNKSVQIILNFLKVEKDIQRLHNAVCIFLNNSKFYLENSYYHTKKMGK